MALDIAVTRDLNGIRAALKQLLPGATSPWRASPTASCCPARSPSQVESQQAFDLAVRLAGGADKVVNGITLRGRDQVMLRVTVAEVQRDIIKQLGIDLSGTLSTGQNVLDFTNANPFPVVGQALVNSNGITGTWRAVSSTVRAMERAGVIRTLGGAEPDGHLGRDRKLSCRRRVSRSCRASPAIPPPATAKPRSSSRNSASVSTSRRS